MTPIYEDFVLAIPPQNGGGSLSKTASAFLITTSSLSDDDRSLRSIGISVDRIEFAPSIEEITALPRYESVQVPRPTLAPPRTLWRVPSLPRPTSLPRFPSLARFPSLLRTRHDPPDAAAEPDMAAKDVERGTSTNRPDPREPVNPTDLARGCGHMSNWLVFAVIMILALAGILGTVLGTFAKPNHSNPPLSSATGTPTVITPMPPPVSVPTADAASTSAVPSVGSPVKPLHTDIIDVH